MDFTEKPYYTIVREYPTFDVVNGTFQKVGTEYSATSFIDPSYAVDSLDDTIFPTLLTKTATYYDANTVLTEALV